MPNRKFSPRITVTTLGARNLAKLTNFYERLGWQKSKSSNAQFTLFKSPGTCLALFGRSALAKDAGVAAGRASRFSGVTLAWNVRTKKDVDAALAHAKKIGAKITQPAHDAFWGGYTGYFADPEGNLWEVAWNPFWKLDSKGLVTVPK